jgi:hypothetical protein
MISPVLPSFLPQCLRDYVPSNYRNPEQNVYLNKMFRQFLLLLPPETRTETNTHGYRTYSSVPSSSPLHKQFSSVIYDLAEITENYCVGGYIDYYLNMLKGYQFHDGKEPKDEKCAGWEIGSKTRFVKYPTSLKEETSEEKRIHPVPHSYPHYLPFCLHMESHSPPSSLTPPDLNNIRSFFNSTPPLHLSMQPNVNAGIMYFQIPPFLLNLNDLTLRALVNFFKPLSKDVVADDLRCRLGLYGMDVEDEEEEEEEEEKNNRNDNNDNRIDVEDKEKEKEKEKNNRNDNNDNRIDVEDKEKEEKKEKNNRNDNNDNNNVKKSFKNKYLYIFPSYFLPSSINFLTNYFFSPPLPVMDINIIKTKEENPWSLVSYKEYINKSRLKLKRSIGYNGDLFNIEEVKKVVKDMVEEKKKKEKKEKEELEEKKKKEEEEEKKRKKEEKKYQTKKGKEEYYINTLPTWVRVSGLVHHFEISQLDVMISYKVFFFF